MSAYSQRLYSHLSQYKIDQLGVIENGIHRNNGRAYPHILPEFQQNLNILPRIRTEFWDFFISAGITLHPDFHHLNSSQAFAFNLFFPLRSLQSDLQYSILGALNHHGEMLVEPPQFEANLDSSEGSKLDVVLNTKSGITIIIEVKLSENAFGSAKQTQRRLDKLRDIYRPWLCGKVKPEALHEGYFFDHYQLLRNIAYADPAAHREVILLMPEANSGLRRKTEAFIRDNLLTSMNQAVRIVFAEDIVASLRSNTSLPENIAAHVEDCAAKYNL